MIDEAELDFTSEYLLCMQNLKDVYQSRLRPNASNETTLDEDSDDDNVSIAEQLSVLVRVLPPETRSEMNKTTVGELKQRAEQEDEEMEMVKSFLAAAEFPESMDMYTPWQLIESIVNISIPNE